MCLEDAVQLQADISFFRYTSCFVVLTLFSVTLCGCSNFITVELTERPVLATTHKACRIIIGTIPRGIESHNASFPDFRLDASWTYPRSLYIAQWVHTFFSCDT